jgi:hypothetical protein
MALQTADDKDDLKNSAARNKPLAVSVR